MHNDTARPFIAILTVSILLLIVVFLRDIEEPGNFPVTPPQLEKIEATGIEQLESTFSDYDYTWPPPDRVPPLALRNMPPGMGELKVDRKKSVFFRAVLPMILAENERIRQKREFLRYALADYDSLSRKERRRLQDIAVEYNVEENLAKESARSRLLRRVDVIPVSLALAQAANESAWGDSRFSVEGNSLFGVWTWDETSGITPQRRKEGKKHLVRSYADLQTSVRAYMHTLNTGHAYRKFRKKRREMRANDQAPDGVVLTGLLERYSERGMAYVAEIREMIRSNHLDRLNHLRLEE
ncbi:MAG: glucosaminidase domain-containing protein [Gammaproteobacteria bacterium]